MTLAFDVILVVVIVLAVGVTTVLATLAVTSDPTNVSVTPLVTIPLDYNFLTAAQQMYPGMRNANPVQASRVAVPSSSMFPTVAGAAVVYTCPATKRAYLDSFGYANPTGATINNLVLGIVELSSNLVLLVNTMGSINAGDTAQTGGGFSILLPGDQLVLWGDAGLDICCDLIEYDDVDGSFTRVARNVSDTVPAVYEVPLGQQLVRPANVANGALLAHNDASPGLLTVRYENSAANVSVQSAVSSTAPVLTMCDPVPRILASGTNLTFTTNIPNAASNHVVWFAGILVPA